MCKVPRETIGPPAYNGSLGHNGFVNALFYSLPLCCNARFLSEIFSCIFFNALCADHSHFSILFLLGAKQTINGAAQGKSYRLMVWTFFFETQNYIPVYSNVADHILRKSHTLALRAKSFYIYSLIEVSDKCILTPPTKIMVQGINNT